MGLVFFHVTFEIWAVIFCVIAILCIKATKHFDRSRAWALMLMFLINIGVLASDILVWRFRYDTTETGFIASRVGSFFELFFLSLLGAVATYYIVLLIRKRVGVDIRKWEMFVYVETIVSVGILLAAQFSTFYYYYDSQGNFHRGQLFFVYVMLASVSLVVSAVYIFRYYALFKKLELTLYIFFITIPAAAVIAQMFIQGLSLVNIAITASFIMLFVTYEMEYADAMAERERERARERISMYQHQIQPHFIFNSLALIRSMCADNQEAREAISHFSGFLRSSVDILSHEGCVKFEEELQTINDYIYMQQKRFGDKLRVSYDTQSMDFEIPPFVLQILVENSIRHGIRRKESGSGEIIIRSLENDKNYIVEVEDDGVGFDAEKQIDEAHAGLKNIRERLGLMSGGKLDMISPIGESGGTLARIYIPKKSAKETGTAEKTGTR